jgi:hypothetical protein
MLLSCSPFCWLIFMGVILSGDAANAAPESKDPGLDRGTTGPAEFWPMLLVPKPVSCDL